MLKSLVTDFLLSLYFYWVCHDGMTAENRQWWLQGTSTDDCREPALLTTWNQHWWLQGTSTDECRVPALMTAGNQHWWLQGTSTDDCRELALMTAGNQHWWLQGTSTVYNFSCFNNVFIIISNSQHITLLHIYCVTLTFLLLSNYLLLHL